MPELKDRKPYVALLLSLLGSPAAFLYVGRPRLAVGYAVAPFLVMWPLGQSGLIFTVPGIAIALGLIALLYLAGFVVPFSIARKVRSSYVLVRYNRWYVYALVVVASAASSTIIMDHRRSLFGYETFRIPTAAMRNTLLVGDFIVGDARDLTHLSRGDVVTYRVHPGEKIYVKRLVAIPGDTVEIKAGRVILNGQPVEEPYAFISDPKIAAEYWNSPPVTLAKNQLYAVGDNRLGSDDSRRRGPVNINDVTTVARMVWFSIDRNRIGLRLD